MVNILGHLLQRMCGTALNIERPNWNIGCYVCKLDIGANLVGIGCYVGGLISLSVWWGGALKAAQMGKRLYSKLWPKSFCQDERPRYVDDFGHG